MEAFPQTSDTSQSKNTTLVAYMFSYGQCGYSRKAEGEYMTIYFIYEKFIVALH